MVRPEQRIGMVYAQAEGVSKIFIYVLGPEHRKGSNVTIEMLSRSLRSLHRDGVLKAFGRFECFLDNTLGENKNSAVPAGIQ